MAGRRIPEAIARSLGLRPGEAGPAVLFFLYFFLITAPFAIVKSVRDASYLDDVGVRYLPWAYGTAVLVGAAVAIHARLQARWPRRELLAGSLLFFAASAAAFRFLFALGLPWITLLYWLWANVFVVVLTTQFWFLVNDVFNPRQAKRLVGFLGSGGILGGIAGGLAAGFLAHPGRPEDLLLAAAGLLVLGAAAVAALFRQLDRRAAEGDPLPAAPVSASRPGFIDSFRIVRSDPYLRLLAVLALLTGIVSTFIDWQSKAVIDAVPAAKINLTAFFGRFNAGLLAVAFLFQLALTGRFLRRFGLRPAMMIYPLALLICSGGVAIWPVLGWALAVKGADKAFSYSIQQSSRELLYIPVAADRKYRAKVFIDVFLNRFSKTLGAGLLLLLFLLPPGPSVAVVGGASLVLIAGWLVLNVRLGKAYSRVVTGHLQGKWERNEGLVQDQADTAKTLVDALESRGRSPSLYALHLYELAREGRLTPEIAGFLEEERAALGPLPLSPLADGEETPWLPPPWIDFLSADADIREILTLPDYQRVMDDYAGRVLGAGEGGETARMELAKAAGLMERDSPLAARLEEYLLDASPEVVHFAAESAGKLRRRESVPWLIERLADPRTRGDASAALTRYGAGAAGTLGDYLIDPAVPAEVRRRIAGVLAAVPAQDTVDALLDALSAGVPGLERDLIDALDRIREQTSGLVFDPVPVQAALDRELARLAAAPARADGLWLFRLLGLLHPGEDLTRAGQCYVRGSAEETAFALELLDHILPLDLKEKIVPLLERLPRVEEDA
jgi:ATP:ADP antiporter, AAA family